MVARFLSAIMVAASACATWAATGSVYRDRCTHAGIRPASDARDDLAVTVQVSTDAPVCRQVYGDR